MNIYVVRHGQTDWNKKGILLGSTDKSLNDEGRKQANQLKKELKSIDFEYIISSDLKRAWETAEIISNSNKCIIKNEKIRERNYGELEGTSPNNINEFWDVSTNLKDYSVESIKEFLNRIFNEVDNIIENYKDSNNLLIVTHYGVIMAIEAYFGNKFDYNFSDFKIKNCEYRKYQI